MEPRRNVGYHGCPWGFRRETTECRGEPQKNVGIAAGQHGKPSKTEGARGDSRGDPRLVIDYLYFLVGEVTVHHALSTTAEACYGIGAPCFSEGDPTRAIPGVGFLKCYTPHALQKQMFTCLGFKGPLRPKVHFLSRW